MTRSAAIVFVLFVAVSTSRAEPGVLRVDLRQPFDEKLFGRSGTPEQVYTEPRGLRIAVAMGTVSPKPEKGLRANFRVKGDFEITTIYELINAEVGSGYSSGVSLYLKTTSTIGHSMMLGRYNRQGGGIFTASHGTGEAGNRHFATAGECNAEGAIGKLRLVRRGPELTCFVADGIDKEFMQLAQLPEFGSEDVEFLRIAGLRQGSSDRPLDAYLYGLEIRSPESFDADGWPLFPLSPGASGRGLSMRGWLLAGAILVAVALVVFIGARRRRAGETAPRPGPVNPVETQS